MRRILTALAAAASLSLCLAADEPPAEQSEAPYDSKTQGALLVKGDTDDWFVVTQDGKRVGGNAPPKLNSSVELAPGDYDVTVNRTRRSVTIRAGKQVVLQTGDLVVEGKGASWYAPYEGKERRVQDAPPVLNAPIALFAGSYSVVVHVGDHDEKLADAARVEPGRKTVLKK